MSNTRLNAPSVDGVIKAQTGLGLQIPFQMNRAVGMGDFNKLCAKVSLNTAGNVVATLYCDKESLYFQNNNWIATFTLPNALTVGQYYKIQLAYVKDGVEGYYSSTVTFKYTTRPQVSISGLSMTELNNHVYTYTGVYHHDDSSEKVYSYRFRIYSASGEALIDSGDLLHNSTMDTEANSSTDSWTTQLSLDENKIYLIKYTVVTVNSIEAESGEYRLIDNQTVESNILQYCDFVAENITDSGCVELRIEPKANASKKVINGQFILLRASDEDGYQSQNKLTSFILASWDSSSKKYLCRDYCVAQGVTYRYALQAYNNKGLYSKRIEAEPVFVDYEDMFLSDGDRQLKIRFNPKVSSFKNTILEQKQDTIGGQYPFFFRNGKVNYKEFSISGLIAAVMDENKDFTGGLRAQTPAGQEPDADLPHNLTGKNFRTEREFKLEVLDWLTNGQPKLFRSPAEGNYIVRLMNASLSPNDTLGRMLHSFSATAYETAECNFENLRKYGMLLEESIELRELEFKQVYLDQSLEGAWNNLNACLATVNAWPQTSFYYKLQHDTAEKTAQVGVTGVYEFDRSALAENPLMSIRSSSWTPDAALTYATYTQGNYNTFSLISDIKIQDCIEQWIGQSQDEIAARLDAKRYRLAVGNIYYMRVEQRPIISVFKVEQNADNTYRFYSGEGKRYYPTEELLLECEGEYYDGKTRKKLDAVDYSFSYSDGTTVDMGGQHNSVINTNGRIVLTDLNNVDYLYLGNGVYINIVYQKITKYFTVEESGLIYQYRQQWEQSGELVDYNTYYNALCNAIEAKQEGMMIDAL